MRLSGWSIGKDDPDYKEDKGGARLFMVCTAYVAKKINSHYLHVKGTYITPDFIHFLYTLKIFCLSLDMQKLFKIHSLDTQNDLNMPYYTILS